VRHSDAVEAIFDLMVAHDWSVSDVAERMGGTTAEEVVMDQAFLCLYLVVDDGRNSMLTFEFATKLARAFGTKNNHFYNLEHCPARRTER
jgi:hypothetical protein